MKDPDLEHLAKLKKDVARFRREADRNQGAYDQVLKRLRDEHSCADLAAAEARAVELEKEVREAKRAFARELKRFEQRWGAFLRGGGK